MIIQKNSALVYLKRNNFPAMHKKCYYKFIAKSPQENIPESLNIGKNKTSEDIWKYKMYGLMKNGIRNRKKLIELGIPNTILNRFFQCGIRKF